MKLAALLLLILVQKSSSQPSISCIYSVSIAYKCDLVIFNPDGFDNFTAIDGEHLDGFSDASLELVEGFLQLTPNLPSIICSQFENIRELFVELSGIEFLTAKSLENCVNLETLFLGLNELIVISDGVFGQNRNLHTIGLFGNRITEISTNSFTGTPLKVLELGDNLITELTNSWKQSVAATLESLTFSRNLITNLNSDTFATLTHLTLLDLTDNPLATLPSDIFTPLVSLSELYLDNTGIESVNVEWFSSLTNLTRLHMAHNDIRLLPFGTFTTLTSLTYIDIAHNRLTELNVNAFGDSLVSIINLHAGNNDITSVDPALLVSSVRLRFLLLAGNVCVNRNFYNVDDDRGGVANELSRCLSDFGFISCEYFVGETSEYICNVALQNPTGRDTFESVSGSHVGGFGNENVTSVVGMAQHSTNIPRVFCRQFVNLRNFALTFSEIEFFTAESFENCAHLETFEVNNNVIAQIPAEAFVRNLKLTRVDFAFNRIAKIGSHAFDNTILSDIWLNNNELREFSTLTFSAVSETLRIFHISHNNLNSLPANAFSSFSSLVELNLNANGNMTIAASAFTGLKDLRILTLNECSLRVLDPRWFADLANLFSLRLYGNGIESLLPGTFANLAGIFEIDLARNDIEILPANVFGNALSTLTVLFLEFNRVNFIERAFLTSADALNFLFLADNRCASENIVNVQANREDVEARLADCFRNFDGFVACDFWDDNNYTCNLTIANVNARDDFAEIEGEHLSGFDNDRVEIVRGVDQFTVNIPSILCETFVNLNEIHLEESRIEVADLSRCTHITKINLGWNLLRHVWFGGHENLEVLSLNNNAIEYIADDAFEDTILREINLNFNAISAFDALPFEIVNETLTRLYLQGNFIESLEANTFVNVRNLESLHIANNFLASLGEGVFSGLSSLVTLSLHSNQITFFYSDTFVPLVALQDLRLSHNQLTTFPPTLFAPLISLISLDLDSNDLHVLEVAPFGNSLTTLRHLFIQHNDIYAIEESLVANLEWLFATGNICVDETLTEINHEALRECFTNFVTPAAIACDFFDINDDYACMLSIFNPGGRVNFERIEGDHAENRENSDVMRVYVSGQNARVFPSVLCETFTNLRMLYVSASRVRFLPADALAACHLLESLVINFNELTEIVSGSFMSNQRLIILQLVSNEIKMIEVGAFDGSQLQLIDLSDNKLREFDAMPFEAVNGSLNTLHLTLNNLGNVSPESFSNLRNLHALQMNYNPFGDLPDEIFVSLVDLQSLALIGCELSELRPTWFASLVSLNALHVSHNEISELTAGIFNSLLSARVINVAANRLSVLNATAFGYSLRSLESMYAYSNEIDAIDREILGAQTLIDVLMLNDNVCVHANFVNVRENLETVRQELSTCFENFDAIGVE